MGIGVSLRVGARWRAGEKAVPLVGGHIFFEWTEVSLSSMEELFKAGGIVQRLYSDRRPGSAPHRPAPGPGSPQGGAALMPHDPRAPEPEPAPATASASVHNRATITLRPMHRCDRVKRGCPGRSHAWVLTLALVYLAVRLAAGGPTGTWHGGVDV
jgi:hypothetical protein